MGGSAKSKTETITDIKGTPIFNTNDDLFRLKLVRSAYMYNFDTLSIITSMLVDSFNITNWQYAKALGFTSNSPITISSTTKDSILSYIKYNIDYNISSLNYYNFLNLINFKAIEFLKANFKTSTDKIKYFAQSIKVCTNISSGTCENQTDKIIYYLCPIIQIDETVTNDDGTTTTVTKNYFPQTITDADGNQFVNVFTDGTNWFIRLVELDDDLNETDITEDIEYYEDIRMNIVASYTDTDGNNKVTVFYKEDVINEANTTYALMIQLKNDGVLLEDNDKITTILGYYGISKKDIFDSLTNEYVKDVLISYIGPYDGIFKEWIDANYTIENKIIANNGMTNIEYYTEMECVEKTCYDVNSDCICTKYEPVIKVKVNGTKVDDNTYLTNNRIVPIELFKKIPLRDKYKAIQQYLSMVYYSQQTVKKKWYQTGFFSFLVQLGAIAISLATGNAEVMILATTATTVADMFIDDPTLKLIFNIAIAVISGSYSSTGSTAELSINNLANFTITISKDLFTLSIENKIKNISSEIKRLQEETEEYQEEIQKIKKQAIYKPYELIDEYYETIYELPYMNFEIIDKMCEINYDNDYFI